MRYVGFWYMDATLTADRYDQLRDLSHPSSDQIINALGTWPAALTAAGLPRHMPSRTEDDRNQIIAALIEVADHVRTIRPHRSNTRAGVPRTLTLSEYDRHRTRGKHPAVSMIYARFGSWPAALVAAGLAPDPTGARLSGDDVLVAAVREVSVWTAAIRRSPLTAEQYSTGRDVQRHPPVGTLLERFGSWRRVLSASGLTPRRRAAGRHRKGSPPPHGTRPPRA